MEKTFSPHWKTSTQRRKQRKYVKNAPLHVRQHMMHSTLSKELRKKYDKRNVQIRKGDKVKISRGAHKGKITTVEDVNMKDYLVYFSDIEVTRKDGAKSKVGIHPSNLIIQELKLDDKYRKAILDRKTKA
jgi:large subunit ribosomal protein L24